MKYLSFIWFAMFVNEYEPNFQWIRSSKLKMRNLNKCLFCGLFFVMSRTHAENILGILFKKNKYIDTIIYSGVYKKIDDEEGPYLYNWVYKYIYLGHNRFQKNLIMQNMKTWIWASFINRSIYAIVTDPIAYIFLKFRLKWLLYNELSVITVVVSCCCPIHRLPYWMGYLVISNLLIDHNKKHAWPGGMFILPKCIMGAKCFI